MRTEEEIKKELVLRLKLAKIIISHIELPESLKEIEADLVDLERIQRELTPESIEWFNKGFLTGTIHTLYWSLESIKELKLKAFEGKVK